MAMLRLLAGVAAACCAAVGADDSPPPTDSSAEYAEMIKDAGQLSAADQKRMKEEIVITNHRARRQLDTLAQRSALSFPPPALYGADLVPFEKKQFAVVADGFRRHRMQYAGTKVEDSEVYWSYDFALDREEVKAGLVDGEGALSGGSRLQKINHMPGIAYLAVKSSLCSHLMALRREHAWFDISPECYHFGDVEDRKRLTAHFKKQLTELESHNAMLAAASSGGEGINGVRYADGDPRNDLTPDPPKPSYWMRKIGSHRNTTLHSTHEPMPETPPDLMAETIFQKYITNPFLVDGKKMELRLFVAITSLEPLSVYLYNDFYLRVAAEQYDPDIAKTKDDAMVHQITGGKMGDIMSQEKWPRAEFEEYLRMEEYDPVETMRRVKQVIGLAVMAVEEDMHEEMVKYAPVVRGPDPLNVEQGQGADTRRFYEVVGFDIMLLHVDRGDDEPGELRPYVLEVNFNPDPSLYHKEDIGPKGGTWHDIVDLAGLMPGGAPVAAAYTTEELKSMVRNSIIHADFRLSVGLANLTDCTTEAEGKPGDDDYKPAQAGTDGMQIFPKVYSMRYRRKLFPVRNLAGACYSYSGSRPARLARRTSRRFRQSDSLRAVTVVLCCCQIKPLECVTRYDLELAVEYDAEVSRAGGYEVVLPSADMKNYHQFIGSNRYADMLLQRLLETPRSTNYTTQKVSRQALADARSVGNRGVGDVEQTSDSEKRRAKGRRKKKQKQRQDKDAAVDAAEPASEAAKAEL